MRPDDMAPMIGGLGADARPRTYMLACLGGQRRLRSVRGGPDMERWARANARRWFVVRAGSVREARQQLNAYLDYIANPGTGMRLSARWFGVIDAGRNAAGGPREFPLGAARGYARPSPSASAGRRARARPPSQRGTPAI